MANYRKSFNLRNGVQVDDDNFVVNANGLVGIGTSVPTEFLDVRGNAKIVGHTTSNTLYAGIATIGNLRINQGINASGVITASSFSGSASGLTGIYAIAVDGWIVNSSNSSITTSFKVGIGTTNPQYSLQIGQNPFGGNGISLETSGNIRTTGIITASSFNGSVNGSNITSTINNSVLPSNISVGIVTASSGFYGSLIGTASTANSITNTANIQVISINSGFSTSGISTIHTTLHVLGNIGVGTLNPNAQIHLRKSGISSIQLTSDGSNSSIITFGRSVTLSSNNAQLRFGNTSGTFPDSTQQSFDVINYDTGNLNFYLNPGGAGTGSFNWFKPNLTKSMVLTSSGNLGINSDSPTSRLSIIGNANIVGIVTASSFSGSGIVPIGGIIMWSGSIATIPSGWSLCNGSNGTPDLRDKFVIGSSIDVSGITSTTVTGTGTKTGGNKDLVVPYHNHNLDDPGHTHTFTATLRDGTAQSGSGVEEVTENQTLTTNSQVTGITIDPAGTSGNEVNANLPPYYALAFIMRIS
jgi:hypothetical protein